MVKMRPMMANAPIFMAIIASMTLAWTAPTWWRWAPACYPAVF